MAVYFFYGEEDYNIDLELDKMRSKLNPDFLSMSYQVLDGPDYQSLVQVLRTPPMMFGSSLFVINAAKYFMDKKDKESVSLDDDELEDIDDALKNNPEGLDIVFVLKLPRGENKKPDSRRKLYKVLSKYNSKEFPAIKTYKTAEILAKIKSIASSKDIIIKDDAAQLLMEQIGNNLREFDVELDKLKIMAYPDKTVTKKMVEDISISNQDLFNLTDYIMRGEKGKALLELKKLLDKKYPLEIISALQTMLRRWILVKTKASLGTFELSKIVGVPEFVLKEEIKICICFRFSQA